jgi:hypothetical protein
MTVSATSAFSGPLSGNGSTTVFPFSFKAETADEVQVFVDGVEQTSGFTVAVSSVAEGGSVTFASPPANGTAVLIASNPSFEQQVEFENAGAFLPESHDEANDRAAIRDIYLKGRLASALRAPVGESLAELPAKADRAGKYLAFDADGNPVETTGGGSDGSLRSDLAASGGSSLVGFTADDAGSTARSLKTKLRDIPAITDYASQALAAASAASSLFMPQGSTLTVAGSLAKKYWGAGKLVLGSGDVPGTQGGADYGFSFLAQPTPGTGQHFGLASKIFTGTRTDVGSAPGQNHGVALYGEAQRGAGSSDGIWGANTVTEAYNLNGPTIGYEIDVNNFSGVDPGLSPAQSFFGLSVISGASGRGGTAIEINRNGDYASNHWNRGLYVREVLQRGIEFADCGNATGLWSDGTLNVVATAAASPVAQVRPFQAGDVLLRGVNAAANLILFDLDQNATANETNMKLSIAGAPAQRVSVGAADSGGTGFRVLRVAN